MIDLWFLCELQRVFIVWTLIYTILPLIGRTLDYILLNYVDDFIEAFFEQHIKLNLIVFCNQTAFERIVKEELLKKALKSVWMVLIPMQYLSRSYFEALDDGMSWLFLKSVTMSTRWSLKIRFWVQYSRSLKLV